MMQITYWAILFCLVTLALADGTWIMKRSVFAILGCGVASLIFAQVLAWPSDTYVFAMMVVDGIAAFVVLMPPAGGAQALIGATYLTQIAVHAAKVINGATTNMDAYWWSLSIMAFAQLLIMGSWWVYERHYRSASVRRAGMAPNPVHRPRDGG